ncbi:MAG TPA: hypothetical protein VKQ70_02420 [Caulobacteraceae bacterium]|nr:hypothetical protein [Caulobacteraceae bacterium]
MPLVRSALIATAACLFGAAAYAQPSTTDQAPPADQSAPPAASSDMNAAPAPATAPVGAAANTSTTVDANGNQVIASQPVPDTPANRAAFGQPLSHAGKHTAPRGN